MIKVNYQVPDMHCPNCVMRLEGLEDVLPGIKKIKASYHKQQLEIVYDELVLTEAEILAAADHLGYTVHLT